MVIDESCTFSMSTEAVEQIVWTDSSIEIMLNAYRKQHICEC